MTTPEGMQRVVSLRQNIRIGPDVRSVADIDSDGRDRSNDEGDEVMKQVKYHYARHMSVKLAHN